jgi:hypothetical protein
MIVDDEKLELFLLKSVGRQEYPLSLLLFSIVLEVLAREIKEGKTKYMQIGRE